MDVGTIIMSVVGVTVAIIVAGYLMIPIVSDVMDSVDNMTWKTLMGVAVVVSILTIAIFPLMLLSRSEEGIFRR